ncbi:MAG: TPM domain-containing protein [Blastocatellia bacterium]
MKSALILPAVILCACLYTLAQSQKFPPYHGHVNDFAGVIDQPTEERLEQYLLDFEQKSGAQIAVVTIRSLEGQPLEQYANNLYRAWGIGQKTGPNKDKGALLLVVIGDRKTRLETGYGLEGDIPDGLAGEMIRRMRPDLQQGRYGQAITSGVRTIVATLAEKWGITLSGDDPQYAYRQPTNISEPDTGASESDPFLSLLLVAFVVIFFLIVARASRRGGGGRGRPGGGHWVGWPMIFNGGGGGFGGGSWGSSGGGGGWGSGGGGWGGFGGGSSGGGGASDSW